MHEPPIIAATRYRLHEGELSIPSSWQDQSMQMFRISDAPSGGDASFIITRDYKAGSLEPLAYAEAQHGVLTQKFAEFRLLRLVQEMIRGTGAAVIDYRWTANEVILRQRQAYVPTCECMLILTLTARNEDFEQYEGAWNAVLHSLQLSNPVGQLRR